MNTKLLYQKIALTKIDLEDLTFNLSPAGQVEIPAQLRDSVARCGLINPPLLIPKGNAKFTIVAGRPSLFVAQQSPGTKFCDCLLLPAATPSAVLLTMALQDILRRRALTPTEKAICWQKAVNFIGRGPAEKEFGPQLELTRQITPTKLEKILTLDREMQMALHQGHLELKTALKLLDLAILDREILFQLINRLHLSSSNQRKLLDYCLELQHRQNRKIATILAAPECREIIEHAEANSPQKSAMLMNWLAGQCYPRLTEAEKEFRALIGQLKLPKGVSLEHTPSFEKDTIRMTIDFPNRTQLARRWPELRGVISNEVAD